MSKKELAVVKYLAKGGKVKKCPTVDCLATSKWSDVYGRVHITIGDPALQVNAFGINSSSNTNLINGVQRSLT